LRKSAKRFSARNPLKLLVVDHVYDFGFIQSKIMVIWAHLVMGLASVARRRQVAVSRRL
jgi:hypothetical protein